jgi:glycerol-3-phosphate acyltransferase PlsX
MRIAVDALGGDRAPREIVAGALAAAGRLPRDEVFLVGDPTLVEPEVDPDVPPNLSLRDAGGPVGMGEEPASALRARPDASVAVAA